MENMFYLCRQFLKIDNSFAMHVASQLNREGNPLPENRLSLDVRAYIEAFLFRAIDNKYSQVEINLRSVIKDWQNFKKYLIGSNAFSIPLKPNIPVKCLAANIYLLHLVTKVTNSLNREQVRCENILPHLLLCSESITRKLV